MLLFIFLIVIYYFKDFNLEPFQNSIVIPTILRVCSIIIEKNECLKRKM